MSGHRALGHEAHSDELAAWVLAALRPREDPLAPQTRQGVVEFPDPKAMRLRVLAQGLALAPCALQRLYRRALLLSHLSCCHRLSSAIRDRQPRALAFS